MNPASTSDSELIAALIANDPAPLPEAVGNTLARLEGATTVVALTEGKLLGFRDPHGFRPLALAGWGRLGARLRELRADLVGAELEREVRPGELVAIDGGPSRTSRRAVEPRSLPVRVHLPRPPRFAARLEEVYTARVRMGEALAGEAPVEADLVMPVPDSGTPRRSGSRAPPESRSARA